MIHPWRLGGRDVRPDRVVCWAGSCSPSLLESLLASLDEVLGSGLVLAERLGAMTGMGSRGKPAKDPPAPAHKSAAPAPLGGWRARHDPCFALACRYRRNWRSATGVPSRCATSASTHTVSHNMRHA
jgi:hypothetical protein